MGNLSRHLAAIDEVFPEPFFIREKVPINRKAISNIPHFVRGGLTRNQFSSSPEKQWEGSPGILSEKQLVCLPTFPLFSHF